MIDYLGALITQCASYYTTLAFVMLITKPVSSRDWLVAAAIALGCEIAFIAMKEQMWRSGPLHKVLGLIGFVVDGFINAGGLGAITLALLTFGPGALMLGRLEVDLSDPETLLSATMIGSVIIGIILSLAPHILWRATRKRPAQRV